MSRFLYQRGVLSLADVSFCVRTYFHCWYHQVPLADLHRLVFKRLFQGKTVDGFAQHVADFIAMRLQSMIYMPALRELHRWKERGARLLLLSGSPDLLVKPIAQALGLCEGYGTEYAVDAQGCLLGLHRLLDGEWKADVLKTMAAKWQVTSSIAYSDHIFDLPLLESVGEPVVVNPERRLKKLARRRGWRFL